MSAGGDGDWEPPRGGWGCLLIMIIGFWAAIFFLFDTIKRLLQ